MICFAIAKKDVFFPQIVEFVTASNVIYGTYVVRHFALSSEAFCFDALYLFRSLGSTPAALLLLSRFA